MFEDCESQFPIFDFDVGLLLPQLFYVPGAQEYARIGPIRYVMIEAIVSVLCPMFFVIDDQGVQFTVSQQNLGAQQLYKVDMQIMSKKWMNKGTNVILLR